MRILCLLVCTSGLAFPQFVDLAAPGDGSVLYFSVNLKDRALFGSPSGSWRSPIYKLGPGPEASLVVGFPEPVLPPHPPIIMSAAYYFSPFYLASHPQFSRDGSVFAFTGRRVCVGGSDGCAGKQLYQTTVRGVEGREGTSYEGKGWLSGNGRFLLVDPQGGEQLLGVGAPREIDLATGERYEVRGGRWFTGTGRAVADDGAAVFGEVYGQLSLFRIGQGISILREGVQATEPVIDAAGRTVVYVSAEPERVLRVHRLPSGEDSVLVRITGQEAYAPAISADGRQAAFLSGAVATGGAAPGPAQLYLMDLGGASRQVTFEALGVVRYAVSDDFKVAWYVSGDGAIVKLELERGLLSQFRVPVLAITGPFVPGSAVTLYGEGLTDNVYSAAQRPLPRELGGVRVTFDGVAAPLIAVTPTKIILQTPWEVQAGHESYVEVTTWAGTAKQARVTGAVTPAVTAPALAPASECAGAYCWQSHGGVAIHQDWSGYVTRDAPAIPGEILYFFGTGFGAVSATPPDGEAPFASPVVRPFSCNLPVLYAGLAPGFPGYFQLNVQVPAALPPSPSGWTQFNLNCGSGDLAAFATGPMSMY